VSVPHHHQQQQQQLHHHPPKISKTKIHIHIVILKFLFLYRLGFVKMSQLLTTVDIIKMVYNDSIISEFECIEATQAWLNTEVS